MYSHVLVMHSQRYSPTHSSGVALPTMLSLLKSPIACRASPKALLTMILGILMSAASAGSPCIGLVVASVGIVRVGVVGWVFIPLMISPLVVRSDKVQYLPNASLRGVEVSILPIIKYVIHQRKGVDSTGLKQSCNKVITLL